MAAEAATAGDPSAGASVLTAKHARHKLRVTAFLFLILLAIPIGVLLSFSMYKLYEQSALQHRFAAEQTADLIQKRIVSAIDQEEARPFNDYSFYTAGSDVFSNSLVQRSPLSQLQSGSAFPGVVGYFQIAPDGSLSSPILPAGWSTGSPVPGVAEAEIPARVAQLVRIEEILALASGQPNGAVRKQESGKKNGAQPLAADEKEISKAAIDRLNSNKFSQESLINRQVDNDFEAVQQQRSTGSLPQGFGMRDQGGGLGNVTKQKLARKEAANAVNLPAMMKDESGAVQKGLSDLRESVASSAAKISSPKITSFEAEVDPFQVLSGDNGYLIFFRKTWRGSQRIIQGAIVEARVFLEAFSEDALTASSLPPSSVIDITTGGKPLLSLRLPNASAAGISSYASRKLQLKSAAIAKSYDSSLGSGKPIFETALPDPLGRYELSFSLRGLPLPAGAVLVLTLGALLGVILLLGTYLLYRLGSSQITLAQKRNDFVSAVSHELKTPLTSIRMYGEMLKNDWVPDEGKKRTYYEYIFQESERLSRLIGNVLRLSKLSNTHDALELTESAPKKLLETIQQKVEQITKSAGFTLAPKLDGGADAEDCAIRADEDSLTQIAINLVENAVKFSRDGERKEVEIGFKCEESTGKVIFFVRDFGPGVTKSEQRKIFGLFYRSENELTRKTSGTGIGLALVKGLASGMHAKIDYRGRDPGAEFQIIFTRVPK